MPALEVDVELGPHEEEVDGLLVAAANGVGERRRAVVRRQVDVHVRHGQQDGHDVRAVLWMKKMDDSIIEQRKGTKSFVEVQFYKAQPRFSRRLHELVGKNYIPRLSDYAPKDRYLCERMKLFPVRGLPLSTYAQRGRGI